MRATSDERRAMRGGLTLVELLVALVVTSIILTAVAALAFALGTANDATDDTSLKQAQVRYATLRISDVIRHCKLICANPGDDLVIWKADDKNNKLIDVNEVVYIEYEDPNIYLLEFCTKNNPTVLSALGLSETQPVLTILGLTETKNNLIEKFEDKEVRRTCILSNCSDVNFDLYTLPPYTKPTYTDIVNITFKIIENNVKHTYQITSALRSWAGNLLSADGQSIVSDDD
jgi:prepilin-type N-terminal cleavage/methylation domain-containing protein